MVTAQTSQLGGAYAGVLAILVAISATAKPNDRAVYVVFAPWLTSDDVQRRIAASGGRALIDPLRLASKVATADRTTVKRLYAHGAALILSAAPDRLCTSGGVSAQ